MGEAGKRRSMLRKHFAGRQDAFASAILVFPLFATYQIGILLGVRGRNGVDYVTDWLIRLCDRDFTTYVQLLVGLILSYAALLLWLRGRGSFHPRAFLPMLAETGVYAFFMGGVIQALMQRFYQVLPPLAVAISSPAQVWVVSAGAGLHEELVFRVVLMGGMIRVLPRPLGAIPGWIFALCLSALIFSAAHHVGPMGEAFTLSAFVYRTLAGVVFGLLYRLRGLAVAAWTHTLYDVFVLASL